ncbi:DEAD/DEAH box helicase [Methanoplanus sp. FWC-SCC4]|uniref:DEAD/DEAH box helicase n=1 Tax=Methanochimaera problematica TaxID=2609417 RepID=A0AA97I299_9EURY|nr:DEAD/DEAH box helicase [Methanoplanus sp. FWC-SCC4]WOF16035.1 DEAD/DEAH box helicase [Methanoplanus sp. FWC-SCC4]
MTEIYGIQNTHKELINKLKNYIQSQYFGVNNLLLEVGNELLEKDNTLYQDPYIESNPLYKISNNGLSTADIPENVREILHKMADQNLGVFESPYTHQIDALESFFHGRDILVTTGTGSGKTECFMWPIIASLANEAQSNPESWNKRGIRALLLYPMNALVSDQIGRLRRMIGDNDGNFHSVFIEYANDPNIRIPQFGMYTGRTPYPGAPQLKKDKELAKTMERDLLDGDPEFINELKKIGRYPAKKDLNEFINYLKEGTHSTDPHDAELITRWEMQNYCPDILVTNYTMLQFMLIREIETSIWDKTREWLNASPENKLLIVIDEAHMYHGSPGGEVALLLRRLMYKLKINRDKIRFILTSASIPTESTEDKKVIQNFFNDLTLNNSENDNFSIISGKKKQVSIKDKIDFSAKLIADISIDEFLKDEGERKAEIENFFKNLNFDIPDLSYAEIGNFLYENLSKFAPVQRLIQYTSGNAINFKELANIVFPNDPPDVANYSVQVLLAIMPLAKSEGGQVLFPARLHMFFRGLEGVFACTNPNCPNKCSGDGITLGQIYADSGRETCSCGGKIYELINDRRCGALFIKGYMSSNISEEGNDLWRYPGEIFSKDMKEINLFIVPENYRMKSNKTMKGWLNPKTGVVHFDDQYKDDGFLKVLYPDPRNEISSKMGILTFKSCPKCGGRIGNRTLSDFSTKGNEPFYNIVASQLHTQPPTIFDEKMLIQQPNAGRKVLLFSDSRQKAAVLAKDMTRSADDEAARSAIVLAAYNLQKWAEQNNRDVTLEMLYPAFLEIANNNNLRLFYGGDKDIFDSDLGVIKKELSRVNRRNKGLDYDKLSGKFRNPPGLYSEQLLKNLCSSYRSLIDLGLCCLEPSNSDDIDDCIEELSGEGVNISEKEYISIFSSWSNNLCTEKYAIGENISNRVRENVFRHSHGRLGVEQKDLDKTPKFLKEILKSQKYNDEEIDSIQQTLNDTFLGRGNENQELSYLLLNKIQLKYNETSEWFRCNTCSGIFPKSLWGHCARCGGESIEKISDFERYKFWREPVLDTINEGSGQEIKTINSEEHTAQLSYKDPREKTWSQTESYEMRFQNICFKEKSPIDVLSCTTTMEVGIDIGSLTAISLRNVPPMRENYQQRAGRAGRRGTSISTIVTYAQNGPHDGWYFNDPKSIISGNPRLPWIDAENAKLNKRHLNLVVLNDFLNKKNTDLADCATLSFYNEFFEDFLIFMGDLSYDQSSTKLLLSNNFNSNKSIKEFKAALIENLKIIRKTVINNPERYNSNKYETSSLLDHLNSEGILPTYSFPQNVVGFYIEDKNGNIEQRPERSLEIAISEYAPGKILVVDKKTYKVGGIYSYHSKFKNSYQEKQATPYFDDPNYFYDLYQCENQECGWTATEAPKNDRCPFCNSMIKSDHKMLKPWGFAPINGRSIPESWAEVEYSYAEEPCYFAEPDQNDLKDIGYPHIKAANRSDKITVINKGINGNGFYVCRKCGAAEVVQLSEPSFKGIGAPYIPPSKRKIQCNHSDSSNIENVYLGHTFNTDMVVFEFDLDKNKINTGYKGLWMKNAAITLTEALLLAASRNLDIDFSELKAGFRIHSNEKNVFIDIYLYDSLSSGAGYSSELLNISLDSIFKSTEETLICPSNCESACHNCLKHYWNQNHQDKLDRFAALDLLYWGMKNKLPKGLTQDKQKELLMPLIERLKNYNPEICLIETENGLYVSNNKLKKKIIIYPAMYKLQDNTETIYLSDRLVKRNLPLAYNMVKGIF